MYKIFSQSTYYDEFENVTEYGLEWIENGSVKQISNITTKKSEIEKLIFIAESEKISPEKILEFTEYFISGEFNNIK